VNSAIAEAAKRHLRQVWDLHGHAAHAGVHGVGAFGLGLAHGGRTCGGRTRFSGRHNDRRRSGGRRGDGSQDGGNGGLRGIDPRLQPFDLVLELLNVARALSAGWNAEQTERGS
jgi:hypothetical protein